MPLDALVACALRASGLTRRARANYLAPRIIERHWRMPRLPRAFAGFRRLQLSDLHLDLDSDFTAALIEKLRGLDFDAVVITGDFRNSTYDNHALAITEAGAVIATLHEPRFGILGNHDFIEQVTDLESLGRPIFLTKSPVSLAAPDQFWIAGIDDPHFYSTHDLARVITRLPPDDCTILLAHSPEIVLEKPTNRFDLAVRTYHGGHYLPGGALGEEECPWTTARVDLRFWRLRHSTLHLARYRCLRCTGPP